MDGLRAMPDARTKRIPTAGEIGFPRITCQPRQPGGDIAGNDLGFQAAVTLASE